MTILVVDDQINVVNGIVPVWIGKLRASQRYCTLTTHRWPGSGMPAGGHSAERY